MLVLGLIVLVAATVALSVALATAGGRHRGATMMPEASAESVGMKPKRDLR
jgi:hypothetical protein